MDSRVGRYALTSGSIEAIDPDCPYAELWIGTHPSGPSVLQDEKQTPLKQAVGGELPFLFKILSAGKALSIQVSLTLIVIGSDFGAFCLAFAQSALILSSSPLRYSRFLFCVLSRFFSQQRPTPTRMWLLACMLTIRKLTPTPITSPKWRLL